MNRVEKVINYLENNIDEQLTIDEIAKNIYLSPVQLYRVFKKTTGLTPIQYHEHLKIKKSLNLLLHSETICDVAINLGYKNYETYTRAFKKICKVTPSDFLWATSFIKAQPSNCKYALVKENASLPQIEQLFYESSEISDSFSDVLIYRLYPQIKDRPKIVRCNKSEEFMKTILYKSKVL